MAGWFGVTCFFAVFLTVSADDLIGTTGTPCISNSTCTGPNEHCKIVTDFDAPCQEGLCECLPCHALDRNGLCAPLNKLRLGDACFGERNEVIIVEHAACFLGVVACKSGFTQNGQYCGDDGGYPFGAPCLSSYYCAGDMKCLNGTCGCIGGGAYKFDELANACVFKQLGDHCEHEEDCQIGGTLQIGYTADRAVCLNNKCSCSLASSETRVAYVDTTTGLIKIKGICVNRNSSLNQIYGANCDLDPVLGGNGADVQVCEDQYVCQRCPEDPGAGHKGRCRSPVNTPSPPPLCYEPIKPPLALSETEVLGDQMVVTLTSHVSLSPIDPNPDTWSWPDRVMAAIANQTWFNNGWPFRSCTTAEQCRANEQCLIPNFCQRGVCACIPPNYQDSYENCFTPASQGGRFNGTDHFQTTPSSNGTLNVETVKTETKDQQTYSDVNSDYYYGMECTSVAECGRIGYQCSSAIQLNNGQVANGLHCLTNGTSGTFHQNSSKTYCLCPSAKFKWDPTTYRCREKEFGDPCSSDAECDTGSYTRQDSGGFKCLRDSSCGCNGPDFTPVTVSVLQAAWGVVMPRNLPLTITRKTYCVATEGHRPDVSVNGNCTVRLLESSDSVTFTCASGLVCLYCPADLAFGMCTSLTEILDANQALGVDFQNSDRSAVSRIDAEILYFLFCLILSLIFCC